MFLNVSQNSHANTCFRVSFLIKLQVAASNFIKIRLWQRCWPVDFPTFLKTPFFMQHFQQLFLLFCNKCERLLTIKSFREKCSTIDTVLNTPIFITKMQQPQKLNHKLSFNTFYTNIPSFLYPMTTSESIWFFNFLYD